MSKGSTLFKLSVATVLAALIMASALFPFVGDSAYFVVRTVDEFVSASRSVISKDVPGVTTIADCNDQPIAWLYDQRRLNVPPERISPAMKDALVSVEDRCFYERSGVDWKGIARAAVKNFMSQPVQEGASTIEQQLIKNHTLLMDARSESEYRATTVTDYGRKIREIRIALDLEDELTKNEILTKYLNLVPFDNGTFGVEAAVQTYFGIPASDLNVPQAALLAGMIQQSSGLDPCTSPEGVHARRNDMLVAMGSTGVIGPQEAQDAKAADLGIPLEPQRPPQGCVAAGDRGFFCDYMVSYLENHGIETEKLKRGGFHVKITLDPRIQNSVQESLRQQASPTANGAAEVMSLLEPGGDSRKLLVMASSRVYGLDAEQMQTV